MRYYVRHIGAAGLLLGWAAAAGAQSFEAVGTRAAGMGGAFVAVADDASAAYWNPAGFASGNIFSIVLDRQTSKSDPAVPEGARQGSGLLFAMGMPALGVSYYQVRSSVIAKAGRKAGTTDTEGADEVRLDTLITHNTGATLLQSIRTGLAVGATLKLVRGIASSNVVPDGARGSLLAQASELEGRASSRFDTDIGVMASGSLLKVGLTVRNLTNPRFETAAGDALRLSRQARAGVAVVPVDGWVVDADLDLTRTAARLGDVREFAAGTEGRLGRKAFVRGGFRVNTAGTSQAAVAAGASYMVAGSVLIDANVTAGAAQAARGWGISARFVY
jgi:hypothetical protein